MARGLSAEQKKSRLLWLRRELPGGVPKSAERWWDFDDTLEDPVVATYFTELMEGMEGEFPLGELRQEFRDASFADMSSESDVWKSQLERWKAAVLGSFKQSVESIAEKRRQWEKDAFGMGLPGSVAAEFMHHYELALAKCENFIGREALIREGLDKISATRAASEDAGGRNDEVDCDNNDIGSDDNDMSFF